MFRRVVVAALLLVGLTGAACNSNDGSDNGSPDAEGTTRSASAGGIDVRATWVGSDDDVGAELAAYPLDRFLLFEVRLDTHSGDLGSIDMAEAARLLVGGNPREPEEWVATSDDAHHRSGVLVFTRDGVTGSAALSLDLGGESVEFGWDKTPG